MRVVQMESLPYSEEREFLVRDALRRYWALIIALGLLFGGAAAYVVSNATETFTSTAAVLIQPTAGNPLSPDSATSAQRVTVAMVTESALVNSPVVATGVAKKLGMSTADAVAAVDASVPPNTQLVDVSFTASTAAKAQLGAQAFADAFLEYRKANSEAVVAAQVKSLADQEKQVAKSLSAAGAAAALTNAKPDANAEVQLYASRLATIQNNTATAKATDTNPGAVVRPADAPDATANLVDQLLVPVAVLLGLLLGFAIALWLVRRDDRIRGGSEHVLFGAPLLAAVPAGAPQARSVVDSDDGVVSESYRVARAGVLAARGGRGKVFAVTGVSEKIRVGDVASNLATALGRSGYEVALVDATAGWEDLGDLLSASSTVGFTELLEAPGDHEDRNTWMQTVGSVDLVLRGDGAADSRDRFHSSEMRQVVKLVSDAHQYTVLASGPVTTAEGSGVALAADSVILVVEDRRTTHAQAAEAVRRCAELGTPILGYLSVPPAARSWRAKLRPQRGRTAAPPAAPIELGAVPDSETTASSAPAGTVASTRSSRHGP